MESLVQCPVCTLFLHNGMTLESHLDTHPKDQVIKALCSFTKTSASCASSRTPTPARSERSYRSRSRTPVTEDSGTNPWNGKEHDRFWGRTPSVTSSRAPSRTPSRSSRAPSRTCRTPRSHSSTNASRICTPEMRIVDNLAYEATTGSNSSQNSSGHSSSHSVIKSDKSQQTPMYQSPASQDYDPQYIDYSEQPEDREVKYSRSAEYNALNPNNDALNANNNAHNASTNGLNANTNGLNANNMYSFNVPMPGTAPKLPSLPPHMMPPRKRTEPVKAASPTKPNNLLNLVKNNISGMQRPPPYMANRNPYQLVPNAIPTFVQKNVQNSMILASGLPNSPLKIDTKNVPPIVQNHFNLATGSFTPGTTVVTQNSQYFYQEMVQNIDPKAFVPTMPPVFTGHENITNVAQTSSECTRMYQNVMLVDQFGNTSCMYTPQPMMPKPCAPQLFPETSNRMVNALMQNPSPIKKDPNKTLIIEVGPIMPQQRASSRPSAHTTVITQTRPSVPNVPTISPPKPEAPSISITEKIEKTEVPGTTKGLKILSNIKVEVPVQHIKSMINTVMDLTGSNDAVYPDRSRTPEKILPDIELGKPVAGRTSPHTFTELKFENATSSKDLSSKTSRVDNKLDTDYGDSCPVPDLICNEKPSISPCSELSESGDNSVDRASLSPKPHSSTRKDPEVDYKKKAPLKIRLNNILVRKNKKILQIKNAKPTLSQCEITPVACSSKSLAPENFAVISQSPTRSDKATLKTISIEEIREKVDYADMEVVMEEEKVPPAPEKTEIAVKEELSSSNDCAFSNEAPGPARGLGPLDPLRPISVSYGSMSPTDFDDESSNRELLDLESAKNKQFVTMMNDNYFGDNIYADYFTPEDRVESYDDKGPTVFKEGGKEAFSCSIWGEPSTKENEFVLPNFIHESYKIADNGVEYADVEDVRRDCKGDVPPLNICADERMPPRGELSGQESNGDMESSWNGIYPEAVSTEAYDLMARESWESDGSEMDAAERRENLEEELSYPKPRKHSCQTCGTKFSSLKELRSHKTNEHVSQTAPKQTYSRLLTARTIKKEEKPDLNCAANILSIDSKGSISSTILEVYDQDAIDEAKPKLSNLGTLLNKEVKRKRRDFVCPTCKVNQLTEPAFTAHLKIHPLECLTCGKFFTRRANLQLHVKTHLGIKEFKCDVCEKRFTTRQKLGEHQNTHTGRTPYKCTLCDDTFRRYSNMVQHRDRHHFHKRVKTRDFVCHCGAVFQSRAKFLWHKETHADKPKACLYCSDKFVHAASLTRHIRRSHNELFLNANNRNKNENVTCPVCKQVYLRSNLRTHLLTHSGKRPYACVVCNKAFTTKWNLKLHRWVHMSRSAKPFKCTLCKGAFIRHTEYVSHMNAHKSVRPYTCNYCGCQFIRKYNCQRHVREHEMAKKFVCNVPECGKSFHRSYYLSEHMKVHSGVRPFSCDICDKTSSNKSNHNKHMKIHHAREMIAAEA